MIKLGIIGCGWIGRHHAGIFSKMDNVQLVSVCDVIEDKARDLAGDMGCGHTGDYREVLDQADAVVIGTPPAVRIELISAAVEAGKDIFCEKPIALNLAEADEIVSIVDKATSKFLLGYVLRFTQPFKLLWQTFASGELGELITCWTRRYMAMDPRKSWHNQQEASGGVALDFGSHDIDWLMRIGGRVRTVLAGAARVRAGVGADEHCQALLSFTGPGVACCDVSWLDVVGENSIGVIGSAGSMAVDRAGVIRKKLAGGKEEVLDLKAGMSVDPSGNVGTAAADGRIEAVATDSESIQQHFIRCITQDIQPAITARQGRDVLATVLAINESARIGRAVEL